MRKGKGQKQRKKKEKGGKRESREK